MKKVFHFDSPRGQYDSEAAVVWCFDYRFHIGFSKFLKRLGISNPDVIKIAGGAKSLASPEHETEREFVLDQIRKSVRLHRTQRVVLMVHSDCGAYGGLQAFRGDAAAEAEHHQEELRRAAECVQQAVPGVAVQGYFMNFEGVWEGEVVPMAFAGA
jgi:hypothetical protein